MCRILSWRSFDSQTLVRQRQWLIMLTLVRKRQLLAQLKENIADMAAYRGNADRVTCCEKESQLY